MVRLKKSKKRPEKIVSLPITKAFFKVEQQTLIAVIILMQLVRHVCTGEDYKATMRQIKDEWNVKDDIDEKGVNMEMMVDRGEWKINTYLLT